LIFLYQNNNQYFILYIHSTQRLISELLYVEGAIVKYPLKNSNIILKSRTS